MRHLFLRLICIAFFAFTPILEAMAQLPPGVELIPVGPFADYTTIDSSRHTATVDLGNTNAIEKIEPIQFLLVNHSDSVLVIKRIFWGEPNCGPYYDAKPAFKGDTLRITYFCGLFHLSGYRHKVSTMDLDVSGSTFIFRFGFKANIRPPAIRTKNVIKLENSTDSTYSGKITITNSGDTTFSVLGFHCPGTVQILFDNKVSWAPLSIHPDETVTLDVVAPRPLSISNKFQLQFRLQGEDWVMDYFLMLPEDKRWSYGY